jgi:hypothetical protein
MGRLYGCRSHGVSLQHDGSSENGNETNVETAGCRYVWYHLSNQDEADLFHALKGALGMNLQYAVLSYFF